MPRIVPSQVVRFIDKVLPQGGGNPTLGRGNAGQLRALVTLVDGIPDELLTMDSDSSAGLACGVAHIKETLATWVGDRTARGNLDPVPGFGSETAVTLIRKALANCPDEAPAPSTAELIFITDGGLRTNLRTDIGAVYRVLSNGEWKAATVLAGSAVEALLLWALQQKPMAEITDAIKRAKLKKQRKSDDLEWWDLHDYIEVAEKLSIITDNTANQARLAKDFRNLIHPGRSQRFAQECNRATAYSAIAAVEHVVHDLSK